MEHLSSLSFKSEGLWIMGSQDLINNVLVMKELYIPHHLKSDTPHESSPEKPPFDLKRMKISITLLNSTVGSSSIYTLSDGRGKCCRVQATITICQIFIEDEQIKIYVSPFALVWYGLEKEGGKYIFRRKCTYFSF